MKSHTLYLCYFGLREPLVQTQVLPYLREIKKLDGLKVSLITFEQNPKQNWKIEEIETEREKLADENIEWHFLTYHKRPSAPATLYDVLNGTRFIIKLNKKEKIDIFHARAHIPMLMAMLAGKITKSKIIFDIRGLMAEEYADGGIWQENSIPFRLIKQIERTGIKKASQIVVLTNRMCDYLVENSLKEKKEIEVIPCCVDFSRIEKNFGEDKKSDRFELIYAGSVTGLYLLSEMGKFFLELKKKQKTAFFRILTGSSPQIVQTTFERLGISETDYTVSKVSPDEVPKYLKKANLGISFRSPTFSQIAASPTKIPEYLACGLPVISNTGIGDTDALLTNEKVGVSLAGFSPNEIEKSVAEILKILSENKIKEHCIKTAHKYFDLATVGSKGYQSIYRRLQSTENN